jgi:hypothetical protein
MSAAVSTNLKSSAFAGKQIQTRISARRVSAK